MQRLFAIVLEFVKLFITPRNTRKKSNYSSNEDVLYIFVYFA